MDEGDVNISGVHCTRQKVNIEVTDIAINLNKEICMHAEKSTCIALATYLYRLDQSWKKNSITGPVAKFPPYTTTCTNLGNSHLSSPNLVTAMYSHIDIEPMRSEEIYTHREIHTLYLIGQIK